MTLRFYVDENCSDARLVRALAAAGIEALTPAQLDALGEPDDVQLGLAAREGLAVVSGNIRDFARLHQQWQVAGRSHAGIVLLVQRRLSIGETARRLARLSRGRTPENMRGHIEYLGDWAPDDEAWN